MTRAFGNDLTLPPPRAVAIIVFGVGRTLAVGVADAFWAVCGLQCHVIAFLVGLPQCRIQVQQLEYSS